LFRRADHVTPLPTHVIGGYLGAGKTTLVNHLLRQAGGERIAVLVNDFGSVNIDADLILGQSGEVLALSGGCVCCSFGADLVGTLAGLQQRQPPPQRVLIETSGVGLPAAVARTARLAPGLQIEGTVVVADAVSVRKHAADPYMGDTVRQQLADADLVLLNKADTVAPEALSALREWLATLAPRAACITSVKGQVPPAVVYGSSGQADEEEASMERHWQASPLTRGAPPAAADAFVSHTWQLPEGEDLSALVQRLSAPDTGLLRAKGWVQDASGQRWLVQSVGTRTELSAAPADAAPAAACGRLVLIGLRGRFVPEAW
jgi:G3E family GTPase